MELIPSLYCHRLQQGSAASKGLGPQPWTCRRWLRQHRKWRQLFKSPILRTNTDRPKWTLKMSFINGELEPSAPNSPCDGIHQSRTILRCIFFRLNISLLDLYLPLRLRAQPVAMTEACCSIIISDTTSPLPPPPPAELIRAESATFDLLWRWTAGGRIRDREASNQRWHGA